MVTDYRDLVITDQADESAGLREANRQLIELVADLAFDIALLQRELEFEMFSRIHGDATIRRLRDQR